MNPSLGIAYKVISVCLFVAMASCIKAASDGLPTGELVFFRSLVAMPVIVVWLLWQGKLATGLRVKSVFGHVLRGVMGTSAMGLIFFAIGVLPLPEATAIGYAAPLLVVVFAALFLGEKVGVFRMTTVAIGMVGVLIILAPRMTVLGDGEHHELAVAAIAAVIGASLAALAQIQIRNLTRTEETAAIAFWFAMTATGLSALTLPFFWVTPTVDQFALLFAAGVLGGIAQILLTSAFKVADASLVAPFEYTSMILTIIVGYVWFDEIPTVLMLIGASLIIVAGIAIVLRERHLGLKRGAARRHRTPHG